jgi:Tfp pilus assembly protein PilP
VEETAPQDLGDGGSDLGDIDDILAGDEESLAGGGYTYEPGDRRDPFKSLLAARDRPALRGPRPEGIPGLLIEELRVTGIFHTGQGWIAQVQAGDKQRSWLLKDGDQLYDGDVVSIAQNEVVFKQIVQDPTALKPFREVVKKLNP